MSVNLVGQAATSFPWAEVWGGIQSLCAVAVAVAAWKGLSTWRREHNAKRGQEIAEAALTAAYKVEDAIRDMRRPLVAPSEIAKVERGPNEPEDAYQSRRSYAAIQVRYQENSADFAELRAIRYRVGAAMGPEARKALEALFKVASDILGAATTAYLMSRHRDATLARRDRGEEGLDEQLAAAQEKTEEAQATIWWLGNDDAIQQRLQKVISEIDLHMRPYAELR